ncbi:hypothetical protein SCALM49S_05404 [Streptomyces californicus]
MRPSNSSSAGTPDSPALSHSAEQGAASLGAGTASVGGLGDGIERREEQFDLVDGEHRRGDDQTAPVQMDVRVAYVVHFQHGGRQRAAGPPSVARSRSTPPSARARTYPARTSPRWS